MDTPSSLKSTLTLGSLLLLTLAGCPPSTTADAGAGAGNAIRDLTDAEAAMVLSSLNAGEIRAAQAVEGRTSPPVADFARMMIDGHTGLQETADGLLEEARLTPEPNGVSRALDLHTADLVSQLQQANETAVDLAYLNSQVDMHREALTLIDCVLGPTVENAAMREFVTSSVRPAVSGHLDLARQLQARVQADAGDVPGDAFDAGALTPLEPVACDGFCTAPQVPQGLRTAVCSR